MNTNLSGLKQFQNCEKVVAGGLDKNKTLNDTIHLAQIALQNLEPNVQTTNRESIINSCHSCSAGLTTLEASGKGMNAMQAKASSLMELIERFSWLHYDYQNVPGYQFASYHELAENFKMFAPDYFLANLLDPAAYNELLAEILDQPQSWVPACNLSTGEIMPYPLSWHSITYSSNGLASGNCLEEALVQAICEVIERENVCHLFMDQAPGRMIKAETLATMPVIGDILQQSTAAGIEFTILEIGEKFGIPTFCVSGHLHNADGTVLEHGVGQGCHLNPQKALLRAFTEYFESIAILEEQHKSEAGELIDYAAKLLPANHSGFLPGYHPEMVERCSAMIDFSELAVLETNDFLNDLALLIDKLAAFKYHIFWVNKTHPQLNIPTVRVFVPGMRSMISGAIYSPRQAIIQNYAAAGNYQLALKHHQEFRLEDPTQKQLYSSPLMAMSLASSAAHPEKLIAPNYQEHFLRSYAFKKRGKKLLSLMAPLTKKLINQ